MDLWKFPIMYTSGFDFLYVSGLWEFCIRYKNGFKLSLHKKGLNKMLTFLHVMRLLKFKPLMELWKFLLKMAWNLVNFTWGTQNSYTFLLDDVQV